MLKDNCRYNCSDSWKNKSIDNDKRKLKGSNKRREKSREKKVEIF